MPIWPGASGNRARGERHCLLPSCCRDLLSRGSLGVVSLRQREWNRAHSHKQKQVKCASDEMRFDGWINLFFHLVLFFDLISESRNYILSGQPFYFAAPRKVNTFLSNFSRRLHNQ